MADGLLLKLRDTYGPKASLDKASSIMVGDSAYRKASKGKPAEIRPDGNPGFNFSNSDRLFAENLGIRFIEPQDFFGWRNYGVDALENREQVAALRARIGNHPDCVDRLKTNLSKP